MNQVANFKICHGHYPEVVIADNIYGTRNNRRQLKELGIRFSGKPLGRPKKVTLESEAEIKADKKRRRQEYRDRIPIEGKFGQGKNGYGLNRIAAKLKQTSESWIGSIFLVMNIIKALYFCAFFREPYKISYKSIFILRIEYLVTGNWGVLYYKHSVLSLCGTVKLKMI